MHVVVVSIQNNIYSWYFQIAQLPFTYNSSALIFVAMIVAQLSLKTQYLRTLSLSLSVTHKNTLAADIF